MTEQTTTREKEKSYGLANARDLDPLMDKVGNARFVLLGEASHGTHEYYTWRTAITKRLINEKGFNIIAVEGDWPDCYRINRYIKGYDYKDKSVLDILKTFNRWPTWMWANWEVAALIDWLKERNTHRSPDRKIGFYGLDVYSLWESMETLISYLLKTDPTAADIAERAMACFARYGRDERAYAEASKNHSCKDDTIRLLQRIRERATNYNHDPEAALNTMQNAHIAVEAENYYSCMLRFDNESWNIRDRHMKDTINRITRFYGPDSKIIIWEHNTHIGDARYTEMEEDGMLNVGQLLREQHPDEEVAIVGFGSYKGKVIAAPQWDGPIQEMEVPPARKGSIEHILHEEFNSDRLLIFDHNNENERFRKLIPHRAIGVVFHPEREKHNYVLSAVNGRYDAFIFLNESSALHPMHIRSSEFVVPETFPFEV
jgi:erythromycin esterase-like protein